jgi:hypothetical protein
MGRETPIIRHKRAARLDPKRWSKQPAPILSASNIRFEMARTEPSDHVLNPAYNALLETAVELYDAYHLRFMECDLQSTC